jgi:hypothetical protein
VGAIVTRPSEREDVESLRDVLFRNGFVRCDIPACNCGSWHARFGLRERMDEICEALREADVLNSATGNLPLNAIRLLIQQRDAAPTPPADVVPSAENWREALQACHWKVSPQEFDVLEQRAQQLAKEAGGEG